MAWLTGLGAVGGGLWNFLECRKEWYRKYHVVNLAILTFSLTLLLFREMNSVLAFVSDAYCVYGSEASASEGEHPFVCRSVRLSGLCPFLLRELGVARPSLTALAAPSPASGTNRLLPVSLPAFLGPFHSCPLSLSGPPCLSLSHTSRPAPGGQDGCSAWRPHSRHPCAASSCHLLVASHHLMSSSPSVCPSSPLSRTLLQPAGNVCTWWLSQKEYCHV